MKKIVSMAMLLAATVVNPVWAHPDHDDVPPPQAPKLELGNKKDGAIIHVTSRGEKVSTAGAKGTLSVANGKARQDLPLVPVGANGLETTAPVKLVKGSKAKVSVTLADSTTVADEFTVK